MPNEQLMQVEKPVELIEVALIMKDLSHELDVHGKPVLPDVEGKDLSDFDGMPIYRFVPPNILRKEPLTKRDSQDVFVFDVSDAPEDLKRKYAPFIVRTNCDVERPHSVEAGTPKISCGRIVELLPLDGCYASLRPSEKRKLGSNFVSINNLENGLVQIVLVDIDGDLPANVYLKVDMASAGERIRNKVSSEVVELISRGNGQFALPGAVEKEMNLQ